MQKRVLFDNFDAVSKNNRFQIIAIGKCAGAYHFNAADGGLFKTIAPQKGVFINL